MATDDRGKGQEENKKAGQPQDKRPCSESFLSSVFSFLFTLLKALFFFLATPPRCFFSLLLLGLFLLFLLPLLILLSIVVATCGDDTTEPVLSRSSPELCVKARGSSSMHRLGCLGDLLGLEE